MKDFFFSSDHRGGIEPLETRIAPAVLTGFLPGTAGTEIVLDADPSTAAPQGLSSGFDGPFLLYVEKGIARVFTKDLNGNGQLDFNEVTGIAAGDGLRLISFVSLHGDVVTNLNPDGTLTDSDNQAANGRDGQILLNSLIEKIELRSVTAADIPLGKDIGDVIALSGYSIFGNVYAGRGFGAIDGGLLIDTIGSTIQESEFNNSSGSDTLYVETVPQIGSIRVGTAASNRQFSFGASQDNDVRGVLQVFTPQANTPGGDIINVRAADPVEMKFNLATIQAGDGGFNGRGGNVENVVVGGDFAGGYQLIAGDGGPGPTGQPGGNVIKWLDLGSITSEITVRTGNGGEGLLGRGGDGGSLTFGTPPPVVVDPTAPPPDPTIPLPPPVPINTSARVVITLGNGGDGLTGGGNGGSQPSGQFTSPETQVPFGLEIVSSTHLPGDLYNLIAVERNPDPIAREDADPGNDYVPVAPGSLGYHATRGFDFDPDPLDPTNENGRNFNDSVYTSKQTDQLVVLFGSGSGFWDEKRTVYLDSPGNAQALTVADFNNDGHPDIATASGDVSAGGIRVFLSQYDPLTGGFIGFSDPIMSPLPALGGFFLLNYDNGVLLSEPRTQAVAVTNMTSGDFDHDGIIDLALSTTYGMMMMRGDGDELRVGGLKEGRGYFYSDYLRNETTFGEPPVDRAFADRPFPTLRGSALQDGGPDALLGLWEGRGGFVIYDYTDGVLTRVGVGAGKVDTNREVSDPGKTDKISLQDANLRDFTVIDIDNDGTADVVGLVDSPAGFLVTFDGNGTGGFVIASDANGNDENRGIRIGGPEGPSNFGLELNEDTLFGILTANTDEETNGMANDLVIFDYQSDLNDIPGIHVTVLQIGPDDPAPTLFYPVTRDVSSVTPDPFVLVGDSTIRAFDVFVPNQSVPSATALTYIQAFKDDRRVDLVETIPLTVGGEALPLEQNGYFFTAGVGGNSSNGPGGQGGSVGQKLIVDPVTGFVTGSFSIVLPVAAAFEGTVRILGGDGGNGFTAAGDGGAITGVSVRYASGANLLTGDAFLLSGDGGDSVKGVGGKGGNLASVAITSGSIFVAGNGGRGTIGGAGGAVIGNAFGLDVGVSTPPNPTQTGTKNNLENSQTAALVVVGGAGGVGMKAGGAGGNIVGFTPRFLPSSGVGSGLLHYVGGVGGNSVRGTGGAGGSVVESGPVQDDNNLFGNVFVQAGAGGNGRNGGNGGNITDFINISAPDITPLATTFLAGNGGTAVAGTGGKGGDIKNVRISGTGIGLQFYFDFSNPESLLTFIDALRGPVDPDTGEKIPIVTPLPYSRFVAGSGGEGFAGAGGAGGALGGPNGPLEGVSGTAISSSMVGVAGRGGDGLTAGGKGGSVVNVDLDSAGQNTGSTIPDLENGARSKVLVISGDGGDAYGAEKTAADPLAFGGSDAPGGDGGDIIGFAQRSGANVVVDMIAGNGGSTINHGSSLNVKTRVGKGGSISNVQVAGALGNTGDPRAVPPGTAEGDEVVPIKAYNDVFIGERMSDFIAREIIGDPTDENFLLDILNDADGNVGIVVGGRGRVKDNNDDGLLDPASNAPGLSIPNGSLINVRATHIMSAVADSVDRIASIQLLQNVGVPLGGVYGGDKIVDSSGSTTAPDGQMYTFGPTPANLDYLDTDGDLIRAPVQGGRLVDGAIVAQTTRTPQSLRDFVLA